MVRVFWGISVKQWMLRTYGLWRSGRDLTHSTLRLLTGEGASWLFVDGHYVDYSVWCCLQETRSIYFCWKVIQKHMNCAACFYRSLISMYILYTACLISLTRNGSLNGDPALEQKIDKLISLPQKNNRRTMRMGPKIRSFPGTKFKWRTVQLSCSFVRNPWKPSSFTVKLARAKLPAKAAGNDCLRFLRVTGGNLPAPACNSHEVFIIRVRADFFKPRDVSFYPVPNTLTKVTICFLWSQWWTFQIWF